MKRKRGSLAKAYDTPVDRFRVRANLSIAEWAREAGMSRTQLGKYRSHAEELTVTSLAALTRAASRILQRRVRASELCDLGDTEPLGHPYRFAGGYNARIRYGTPLDRFLRRIDVPPSPLARLIPLSPNQFRRIRADEAAPRVSTVRDLVRTLRRMGYDVKASELFDIGENRPSRMER